MRVCVFSIFVLGSILVHADPVTIDHSGSPDGKYFLTIEGTIDKYSNTSDTLQIRRLNDRKVMGSFDWSQFGRNITPTSAKALWSPGSSAFALTWYMARGWTGTEVYAANDAKWTAVAFPKYEMRLIGKGHISGRGKGQFVPDKWISSDVLEMILWEGLSWDGTGIQPNIGDADENDSVFFRLTLKNGAPKLQLLRLEARHEHNYDL